MGRIFYKQPIGLMTIFSTNSDRPIYWNVNKEDYIKLKLEEYKEQLEQDAKEIFDDEDPYYVKDFNEKIQETKVTTASDKIALADEYKKIINKNSKYEYTPGVTDVMESSANYCDHSLRYAGRKMGSKPEEISKEIQDTTLTAEEIEMAGPFFSQNSKFSGWLGVVETVDTIYKNLVASLNEKYTDIVYTSVD